MKTFAASVWPDLVRWSFSIVSISASVKNAPSLRFGKNALYAEALSPRSSRSSSEHPPRIPHHSKAEMSECTHPHEGHVKNLQNSNQINCSIASLKYDVLSWHRMIWIPWYIADDESGDHHLYILYYAWCAYAVAAFCSFNFRMVSLISANLTLARLCVPSLFLATFMALFSSSFRISSIKRFS